MKIETPPKMRELMPEGYLAKLVGLTGHKSYSNLAQIVRNEHTSSKHWWAVVQLAKETNPARFAAWAAANPDKLPAQAFAEAA